MGLKEHDETAIVPKRLEGRGDLRRSVGVVVEDFDAPGLAPPLEPPADAGELRKGRRRLAPVDASEIQRGERARCVAAIVEPRHGELALVRSELVAADDLRKAVEP